MTTVDGRWPAAEPFLWAVGIENTAIGTPIRDGGRTLDEFELTEHYQRWRDDLRLVADLGCTAIRYGIPWYRVNPAPHRWDWSWLDEVIDHATDAAGLTVIADLVHYGTPRWLSGAFTDPRYPDAVAEFAAAVASRYRGRIRHYTPLNEPLVTASFCGERAVWPPYDSGEPGWARVIVAVVDGIQRTIAALRATDPGAGIVHVEAAQLWQTAEDGLHVATDHLRRRAFLPTDLLLGRVHPDHPLYGWLVKVGVAPGRLAELRAGRQRPDVIGVNYYPQLSGRELARHGGGVVSVAVDRGVGGLTEILRDFHDRYRLPLLLSETSVDGSPPQRRDWLVRSTAAVGALARDGLPIVGYTWWPLFDFVDWSWASAGRGVEEFYLRDPAGAIAPVPPRGAGTDGLSGYLRRMGLYRLGGESPVEGPDTPDTLDTLDRVPTAAVPAFQELTGAAVPMPTIAEEAT